MWIWGTSCTLSDQSKGAPTPALSTLTTTTILLPTILNKERRKKVKNPIDSILPIWWWGSAGEPTWENDVAAHLSDRVQENKTHTQHAHPYGRTYWWYATAAIPVLVRPRSSWFLLNLADVRWSEAPLLFYIQHPATFHHLAASTATVCVRISYSAWMHIGICARKDTTLSLSRPSTLENYSTICRNSKI